MSYYLDINALNHIPSIFDLDKELYISAWVIFELLSGILNEREFRIRKSTLKKLKNSNIKVIEHFQSSLCAEIFSFDDWNENKDVQATMKMFEQILGCPTYEEYKAIEFFISDENKKYNYELFQKFDKSYSDDHAELLSDYIKNSDKQAKESGQKKVKYDQIPSLCSCKEFKELNRTYAKNFASLHLRNAILDGYYLDELFQKIKEQRVFSNLDKIKLEDLNEQLNSKNYKSEQVELLQKFKAVSEIIEWLLNEKLEKSMKSFDNYITNVREFNFPAINHDIINNAISHSFYPARNDSQDIGHLYFIDHAKYFVSNDHFFQRIKCLKGKVLSTDEFIKNHL